MALSHRITLLLLTLLTTLSLASTAAAEKLTIHAWPLAAPSPQPLAHIAYDPATGNATLSSWAVPASLSNAASPDALVRLGLRDPSPAAAWTGILTSARALGAEFKKTVVLHADREGRVYGVGFGAEAWVDGTAPASAADDVVDVRVEKVRAGPEPMLNKPVVLDETGKVKGQQVEEKTFLQKYWWVLALFLVMQLAAGGKE